jgi:hypothetical protein
VQKSVRCLVVAALAGVASVAGMATAQDAAPRTATLTVEWGKRSSTWLRPAVEGYVYNPSSYRIGTVRLKVQLVDGTDRVVSQRTGWVYGNIPAGDRGYFVVPILPDDGDVTYRISVDSFFVIAHEPPRFMESP